MQIITTKTRPLTRQAITADGDCIVDVVMATFRNLEALFDLAILNNTSIDAEPGAGAYLVLPTLVFDVAKSNNVTRIALLDKSVKARAMQAFVDIAMQEAGSVESLFEVAVLNGLSITEKLTIGNAYLKPVIALQDIVKVFKGALKPASDDEVPNPELPGGKSGIGYWGIEIDFEVQ